MNEYSTLPKLRKYLSLASQQTDDDEHLRQFLRDASRALDRATHRHFYPERKTRHYDLPANRRLLRVDDDLLETKGLSDLGGASEIDSGAYWPKSGDNYDDAPYDRIELKTDTGSVFNFSGTTQRAVYVDGIWGYHDDYGRAWQDANVTLASALSDSATSIILSGLSSGSDIYGGSSRIQVQHLLKIGDEYLYVISGSEQSSVNVRRGENGTTATSHGSGASIAVWRPVPEIEYSARELAAFQYAQSTSPRTGRVRTFMGAGFSIEEMDSWPPSVRDRIKRLKKTKVYSFGRNSNGTGIN